MLLESSFDRANRMVRDNTMQNRRTVLKQAGATATAVAGLTGLAGCAGDDNGNGDGEFPTEDLRVIVPYGEGGGTDVYFRQFMPEMADELGVSAAIENIEGAGGVRGLGELHGAEPDGHTIGGDNPPSAQVPAILQEAPYDMSELKGVGQFASTPMVVVANDELGLENFDDLFEAYEEELDAFASHSRGHFTHVLAILMRDDMGMDWENYVAFPGSGPVSEAVMSGEVPAGITTDIGALDAVETGDVNVVGSLYSGGSGVYPEAEPITDAGHDDVDFLGEITRCVFAPPETPDDRIQDLTEALEASLETDSVQEWAEDTGSDVTYAGPEEATEALRDVFETIPETLDVEELREEVQE